MVQNQKQQEQEQVPQFPFKEIAEKIEKKRDVYIALIRSTFNFSAQSDAEKTQIANDKFTAEKEIYIERLKSYYVDCLAEHKTKGRAMPTLSIFQGANIFMEVMQTGLSFSETANHIYLAVMKGSRGAVSWSQSADGVVYLAQKSGAISHLSDVVIVRKGEKIAITNENGELKVKHSMEISDAPFEYRKDFLCGYVYVVYPGGYRELRVVTRQQMDDAYSMSRKPENYNKLSMLKSKVVRRALRFDRKTIIETMVKTMKNSHIENGQTFDFDIDKIPEAESTVEPATESEAAAPEQQLAAEITEQPKPQQKGQPKKAQPSLLDGLDLDF